MTSKDTVESHPMTAHMDATWGLMVASHTITAKDTVASHPKTPLLDAIWVLLGPLHPTGFPMLTCDPVVSPRVPFLEDPVLIPFPTSPSLTAALRTPVDHGLVVTTFGAGKERIKIFQCAKTNLQKAHPQTLKLILV